MNLFRLTCLTLLFLTPGMFFAQAPDSWRGLGTFPEWPFPYNRHEHAAIAVGGKFYVIGGRGNKPVQIYDPQTNEWQDGAQPELELHHMQLVSVDGLIYVIGAFTGNFPTETPVPNVYIYDPAQDQWAQGPVIPANRRRGAAGAVVYNDKIYVVSGIVNGHTSGWVPYMDVFDPSTGSWTALADAPRARDHFHAALVGDNIYVAGGRRSGADGTFNATVGEVDVYDIGQNTWRTLGQDIPTERAGCTAAVLESDVLIIGGESGTQQDAHDEVEALDTRTGSWRSLAPMNQGRHGMQAVTYEDEVYVIGGSIERGANEIGRENTFFMEAYTPDIRSNIVPYHERFRIRLSPNPLGFNRSLRIEKTARVKDEAATISLLNLAGQQVWQQAFEADPVSVAWEVSLPETLAPGTYLLRVQTDLGVGVKKLLVHPN